MIDHVVKISLTLFLIFSALDISIFAQTIDGAGPTASPAYSESVQYTQHPEPKDSKKKKKKADKTSAKVSASSNRPTSITFPISVFDSKGNVFSGLKKADLEVFLSDKEQDVVSVVPAEEPLDIILLVDTSPSTENDLDDKRNFLFGLIKEFRPLDRLTLVTFSQRIRLLLDSSTDRNAAQKLIRKLEYDNGTSFYDAVDSLDVIRKNDKADKPPVVILLTDGVDTTSRKSNYRESLTAAQRIFATFYPIYVDNEGAALDAYRNLPVRPIDPSGQIIIPRESISLNDIIKDYEEAKYYLEDISNLTGGKPFVFKKDKDLISKLCNDIRSKYFVTIKMPESKGTKAFEQVKIRINKSDLFIRTKQTLFTGNDQ